MPFEKKIIKKKKYWLILYMYIIKFYSFIDKFILLSYYFLDNLKKSL